MAPIGRHFGRVALLTFLLVSGFGATEALAQGGPESASNPILVQLQQLQASVAALQQSVDALGATTNFLFTAPVIAESGIVDCNHVNVTNAERHVATQLINASTGAVVAGDSGLVATQPGRARGVGVFVPGAFTGVAYCKFTVLDGVKSDIRANLTLTPNIGSDETTSVSVGAK